MSKQKYPWPSSKLGHAEMAILHAVREASDTYQPITKLIARAVRETYGNQVSHMNNQPKDA